MTSEGRAVFEITKEWAEGMIVEALIARGVPEVEARISVAVTVPSVFLPKFISRLMEMLPLTASVEMDFTEVRPIEPIRCDYCGDALPSVKDRLHLPTTPDLQRLGFDADKIVCPECVARARMNHPDGSTR